MRDLIEKYLPNAPKIGLYVGTNIPDNKLKNALRDYATGASADEVLALFDATLMGSGKDGAVFLEDRMIYQNTDLDPAQEIRYDDIVRVHEKRRLLGGKQIILDVNSANATVEHKFDFSGHPDAAPYVRRFLHEAMLRTTVEAEPDPKPSKQVSHTTKSGSSVDAVYRQLDKLRKSGQLSEEDFDTLIEALMNA